MKLSEIAHAHYKGIEIIETLRFKEIVNLEKEVTVEVNKKSAYGKCITLKIDNHQLDSLLDFKIKEALNEIKACGIDLDMSDIIRTHGNAQ